MPTATKLSDAQRDRVYDQKQARGDAHRAIAKLVINSEIQKAFSLKADLQAALDPVVDGFFRTVADEFMGKPEPLIDLLPEDSGLVGEYNPLNTKYVRYKKNNNFWQFNEDLSASAAVFRRVQFARGKRFTFRAKDRSLIEDFKRLSGLEKLGQCHIEVSYYGGVVSNGQFRYKSTDRLLDQPYERLKIDLKISFYPKLGKTTTEPEALLFGVGSKTYHKLMNREDNHRPLLVPALKFYTTQVFPLIIQNYLDQFSIQTAKRGTSNFSFNIGVGV